MVILSVLEPSISFVDYGDDNNKKTYYDALPILAWDNENFIQNGRWMEL